MREILFRGKDLHSGEWHYGNYAYSQNEHFIFEKFGFEYKVDPETVGQFTGLTDKNGRKIFEGDICRLSRVGTVAYGKITFMNGCYWFKDDGFGGLLRLCDCKTNGFDIEVISNIHNNPELLEGGADNET